MDLQDIHARKLKVNIKKFNNSRPVKLTDPEGVEYENLFVIWNDVEHGLKFEGISENPMGEKSSIYFDTDTLFTMGIAPTKDWKVTGSPNKYELDKTYYLEIPKEDRQLPGKLFFLSEDKGSIGWDKVTQ